MLTEKQDQHPYFKKNLELQEQWRKKYRNGSY